MSDKLELPKRKGSKPDTTQKIPHSQLTQHGSDEVVQNLHEWCFSPPSVKNEHSGISASGACALVLHEGGDYNHGAFMVGREFAHIHPHPDSGSMHVKLNAEDAKSVIDTGWGKTIS